MQPKKITRDQYGQKITSYLILAKSRLGLVGWFKLENPYHMSSDVEGFGTVH